MKIKIKETGKTEELIVIDPKTGIDIAYRLTSSDPDINHDSNDQWCSQETFNRWHNFLIRFQKAADRYHKIREALDDEFALVNHVEAFTGVDLENYPEALMLALDVWEKKN